MNIHTSQKNTSPSKKIETEAGLILGIRPIKETSDELIELLDNKENYYPFIEKVSESRKREWLTVRVLLKELIGEKDILYTPTGKPYLADNSFHIGISHTKGYVAVILDKQFPIAVDIEAISNKVEKVQNRFLSEGEKVNIDKENRLIHILLHWSAKESMFKILDQQNVEFCSQLHIDPFTPVIDNWASFSAFETRTDERNKYIIHYFASQDYVLTYLHDKKI